MNSGHLYVLEFSSGVVKVGRSVQPTERIRDHVAAARRFGVTLGRSWTSDAVVDEVVAEALMLAEIARTTGGRKRDEWVNDISFAHAVEVAKRAVTEADRLPAKQASPPPAISTSHDVDPILRAADVAARTGWSRWESHVRILATVEPLAADQHGFGLRESQFDDLVSRFDPESPRYADSMAAAAESEAVLVYNRDRTRRRVRSR